MDEGMKRRLLVYTHKSRFVDKPKRENEFQKDITLLKTISESIELKNAIIQLLLQYVEEYYKSKEVKNIDKLRFNAKESSLFNDNFKMFLDDNFVITGEDIDKVNKKQLMDKHSEYTRKHLEFKYIKNELDRFDKLTYKHDHQYKGYRGVIYGLKIKTHDDDDDTNIIEKDEKKTAIEIVKNMSEVDKKKILEYLLNETKSETDEYLTGDDTEDDPYPDKFNYEYKVRPKINKQVGEKIVTENFERTHYEKVDNFTIIFD
jgi:hypothetical protein